MVDPHRIGHVGRVVQVEHAAVCQMHAVDDRRGGRDQVEIEFAFEPLLNNFEVQQPEKAAAEAKAERRRGLRLVNKAGVVEAQLGEALAQFFVIGRVGREETAEDDRLHRLKTRQGLARRAAVFGDRVADPAIGDGLDAGGDKADLAGAELRRGDSLGREDADALDLMCGAGCHQPDLLASSELAVLDPHEDDDAEIGIVPAVDEQGLQGRGRVALRRRQALDQCLQHILDPEPGFGRDQEGVRGIEPDDILDLLLDPVGLGGRQIDLVQDRHDLVPRRDGLVDIGESLRLDALARIDDQERAFAGRQRAAHFVGEIDMAGGVHQIEDIVLTVAGFVFEADGLRLDRDAALALDLHRVEHLLAHLARFEPAAGLDEPVGQGRFAMVDMGDDRKVADMAERRRHRAPAGAAGT